MPHFVTLTKQVSNIVLAVVLVKTQTLRNISSCSRLKALFHLLYVQDTCMDMSRENLKTQTLFV